ncbi:translocator protein-like [Penaeus monodon]|uniref:translocator protein-like n=1 Tax=Penaeus monodon TaxID=6687 RepID=UPI0018A78EB8|nr:translocator protein-like [Penaeus monodon]XP_037793771.1 translocator protein-like [Penaeus monodon]XP_037793772.1 translocator protein-like [Penaeus monodon]
MLSFVSPAFVAAIAAPYPGAAIGGYITSRNMKNWYMTKLRKPWWRPPNYVFGPVWTVLYSSMGYASYLVYRDGGGWKGAARLPLLLYGSQLALNWAWTPLFFGKKWLGWACIELVALNINIAACIWTFGDINITASYLMLPYLAWGVFATGLNYWIYDNNKDGKHLQVRSQKKEVSSQ